MRKLFGTDGIRGKANSYPMTPEMAMKIGKAAAKIFRNGNKRHSILIGKDTRISGYILENALTSGICSMGVDVLLVGPLPTPAIAHLTKSLGADASIMISASHNPAEDNGIKFFSGDGYKLSDEVEENIEREVFSESIASDHITGDEIGKAYRIDDAPGRYIEYVKATINSKDLSGIKVVVDCAHGASYLVAPKILKELGVTLIPINFQPDGLNINKECGSTYLKAVQDAVLKHDADIGISLDGDADRCLFVDEKGDVFDGDDLMAVAADYLKQKGKLGHNTLVGTIMSNQGLEVFCRKKGINFIRTDVGDRYVIEQLKKNGFVLGGENSGHIIFSHHSTTGDGILSAIQLLSIMKESGRKLSELRLFQHIPQVLVNVDVVNKKDFKSLEPVKSLIERVERKLNGNGRVLIRCSGTQNICRVMVEGMDMAETKLMAQEIGDKIKEVDTGAL